MASTTGLQRTPLQAKTIVLLTLWQMGGAHEKVNKSKLTNQSKRSKEKVRDYNGIFQELLEAGAISLVKEKRGRAEMVSLTEKGLQILGEGLKNPEFRFKGNQVGSKVVNKVLDWYRQSDANVPTAPVTEKVEEEAIASYEDFQSKVLALFEKLDIGYNYGGLVPIWHLRRELGEGVGREEFNEWIMEMQGQKLFYLQSGEARGATDDQKQDSITSKVRGLLFYASQPS